MSKVENAKTPPKIYYGLHMLPGVAEYRDAGTEPYRIFVSEDTIKNMDASFAGKPLFVQHVDEVNLENIQNEADGYVIESFFNKQDGKHWAKFIVVSDKGHEAISSGWKLSNAYIPKKFSGGGLWNGVEYLKEIVEGEYEHLALVPNPRYAESIIYTPEQFKRYNEDKENELKKVANSNHKGEKSMLNFFKKAKVENATDLENMSVVLPKTKKEVSISQLVNEMDDMYKKDEGKDPKAPAMANVEDHVKMNEDVMKVKDMMEKHMNLQKEYNELKEAHEKLMGDHEALKKQAADAGLDMGEEHADKDKAASDKTENEEGLDMGEDKGKKDKDASDKTENKKKNELEAAKLEAAKKAEAKKKAEALKNAPFNLPKDPIKVDLDKAERGRARYGSGN